MTQSTPDPPDITLLHAEETVMEDFIFGGIEADLQQRLIQAAARGSGLRHRHDIDPLDPQPGQPVTVTVYVGPAVIVDHVTLYLTTDGSNPGGRRGTATNGESIALHRVAVQWNGLLWDYAEVWQGQIAGQPAGTLVQYRIEGWCSYADGISIWSGEPKLDRSGEQPALYGYHVDQLTIPTWAQEAIVYHIFVDRFAPTEAGSNPQPWLAPTALTRLMGGTLRGILNQLDYIASLGVTAIWLSPIFVTPSYHGYDITDYFAIDPHFGTQEDLRELVNAAHARQLRVILDFVANHTSVDFAPFAQAQQDPASPYRHWFSFDPAYRHGYRTFFDVPDMPQLNTDEPDVRRFLIDAARYWLTEFDIDGYRLDYAAGPSHAFWSVFRVACRQAKPDCWLFGEVTLAGAELRTYTGRLDGCLDFTFCRLVRQLCTGARPAISIGQFASAVERQRAFFGASGQAQETGFSAATTFLLPSFLDNHDMNRLLWVAGNDPQRLRLAAALLFALGGPPILYYGTEVGLSQPRSKGPWREESRHPMLWGSAQDQSLLIYFKQLIHLRRTHPALAYGTLTTHSLDDTLGVWVVERRADDDCVLLAVNSSEHPRSVVIPAGEYTDLAGLPSRHTIGLAPHSAALLVPRR